MLCRPSLDKLHHDLKSQPGWLIFHQRFPNERTFGRWIAVASDPRWLLMTFLQTAKREFLKDLLDLWLVYFYWFFFAAVVAFVFFLFVFFRPFMEKFIFSFVFVNKNPHTYNLDSTMDSIFTILSPQHHKVKSSWLVYDLIFRR